MAWAQLIFNLVMVLAVLLLLHIFLGRLESLATSTALAAAAWCNDDYTDRAS